MDLLNVVIRADTSGSDRAETSLDKMTVAAREADTALAGLGNSSTSASAKMNAAAARTQAEAARLIGATKHNTAGIAAQFQDIGVTAAMGMNPLMIALQQGTQLTGQLATMDRPLQTLGKSLLSLLSPLSIITIGLVALVAAGLQMVDWGRTAEVVLDTVANVLVPIAPYAAAAALALALLYAPAIIAGIGTAIGMIEGMGAAVWGLATAIYATIGLPALLIAGFLALAVAAVVWRDDLTKMLGVDIVGAAQQGVNWIIGAFVGGFNLLTKTWGAMPAAIADLTVQAANGALDGIAKMLNESRAQIIQFLGWASSAFSAIPGMGTTAGALAGVMAASGEFKAPKIPNLNEGVASRVGQVAGDEMSSALGVNYVGEGVKFVQGAASGAADALRHFADMAGAAGSGSKKAAAEAKSQAEAYADIVRGAEQHIAASEREVQAMGMTEEAAARLRYEQELLNKAANDNINLTPQQTEQLTSLAAGMAAAEEGARRAKDAFDFAKGAVKGFLSDLRSGLDEGKGFWESFGNAANHVLDKIISKVEDQLVDALFSMGSATGGAGGGLGNIFGWLGSLFGFADGGFTGNRATDQVAGIVHGGEYVFSAAATSRIGVGNLDQMHHGARGYAAGGYVEAAASGARSGGYLTVKTISEVRNGNLVPVMTEIAGEVSGQKVQQSVPIVLAAANQQANKSAPSALARYQQQEQGSDYRVG